MVKSKFKSKSSVLERNANLALLGAGIVLSLGLAFPSGVNAQATFEQEVEKVEDISNVIAGIVTTMTDVTILPMGISASMRTFRHIVLANV